MAQIAIVRCAMRTPEVSSGSGVPISTRPAEVAWALIPAVALGAVLLVTWRAVHPPDRVGAVPAAASAPSDSLAVAGRGAAGS